MEYLVLFFSIPKLIRVVIIMDSMMSGLVFHPIFYWDRSGYYYYIPDIYVLSLSLVLRLIYMSTPISCLILVLYFFLTLIWLYYLLVCFYCFPYHNCWFNNFLNYYCMICLISSFTPNWLNNWKEYPFGVSCWVYIFVLI